MFFINREDAGNKLAVALSKYKDQDVIVYGLPRGGVVLAEVVAKHLHAPLDIILARKIGHPHNPEYAIAAISENGHLIGNPREINHIDSTWLESEKAHQMQEIKRRRASYMQGQKPTSVKDKIAILVDDGIATGLTIRAAILDLLDRNPKKLVVAVPVSPKHTLDLIRNEADECVALTAPNDFEFLGAVGSYYKEFAQVEDKEVISILSHYAKERTEKEKHS